MISQKLISKAKAPSWGAGVFAIGDQLLMVAGNFLLHAVIARAGSVAEFGRFTALYSLVVLVSALHVALIGDPVSLSRYRTENGRVGSSNPWRALVVLFTPICLIIPLVGAVVFEQIGDATYALLALASVSSAIYWTAKAHLHALGNHTLAFQSSAVGCCVMLLCATIAVWYLSPVAAGLIAIAISGLAAAGFALIRLERTEASQPLPLRAITSNAKAGLTLGVLGWAVSNVHLVALGFFGRETEAAGLKAVLTVLLPVNQVLIGASLFLLPRMALMAKEAGNGKVWSLAHWSIWAAIVVAFSSGLITIIFASPILTLLFGSSFADFSSSLRAVAFVLPISWAVFTISRTYFRAVARPMVVVRAYVVALTVSLPSIWLAMSKQISITDSIMFLNAVLAGAALVMFYDAARRLPRASFRFSFAADTAAKAMRLPWFSILILVKSVVPRCRNRWVFGRRSGFGDGPLAVLTELKRVRPEVRCVWIARTEQDLSAATAAGIEAVRAGSLRAVWQCVRAGHGVMTHGFSDLEGPAIWGARVAQLWHGIPFKKIGLDRQVQDRQATAAFIARRAATVFERYWNSHYSIVAVSSVAVQDRFETAFGLPRSRLPIIGDPRIALMLACAGDGRRTLERIALLRGLASIKFVLLAPTWRDGGGACFSVDPLKVKRVLDQSDAVLFYRPHPHAEGAWGLDDLVRCVHLSSSDFPDINSLLGGFDVLMTDYSSIAADFSLLERPVIFAAPDLETYSSYPGLYEPYELTTAGQWFSSWDAAFDFLTQVLDPAGEARSASVRQAKAISQKFFEIEQTSAAARVVAHLEHV